ncbi:protein-L-isoaspartate O-methyltransferase [Candidatus Wolfebacteria bacterium RIFCSPHIGHO2_01_FULL_48_22]|uniref:Protein-L-isoaspartate O-methyltransferase n=2 Tax=Candidatus Wolfeibacteriota TaxID=1752735 RepID=A0A1F8DRN0_9BACT|nr:MAG: protein-L-isoaspartate O-methyltransferase [Candidatus Wolfebacteria bacterium RIFCSPHIGHO2_01_FULL_48_22]OGM92211.1 MAG: protein-L-isoaspartate O-methyltransferase [Candidatus Wolfebacteria bacterium RIFCSPLOWO2_01_FULL_47_17b]
MTNEQLVEELIKLGYIKTPRVEDAFLSVAREHFVSADMKERAYENIPLPIGFEQTISQPLVVAFMLELLQVRAGDRVLEIGSGSGWQSALLSFLSGSEVVSIERIHELHEFAKQNATVYPNLAQRIEFIHSDGSKGYEEKAPYDKIIAGASAEEIPAAWQEQVAIGGRIVAPLDERIVLLEKTGKQEFTKKEFFGFRFVPLVIRQPAE